MNHEVMKIVDRYAHDYRDMSINQAELHKILIDMLVYLSEKDLIKIYD